MRCLLPIAPGLTLNLNIWFPLIGIGAYLYFFRHQFKSWRYGWGYGAFSQTLTHYPISLRADVLREKAIILSPISFACAVLLIGNGLPEVVNVGLAVIALTLVDYSLAFVAHARKTWLEVA